jgi:hypothetical protein
MVSQLSGTVVMGLPIMIQLSEADKNRQGLDIAALARYVNSTVADKVGLR